MTQDRPNLQTEISDATQNFLDRFGDKAPREAEIRAQELLEAGQDEARAMWLEIAIQTRKALGESNND